MKSTLAGWMVAGLVALAFGAQADTLQRIQESGRITLGVRDSSGAISYAIGNGQFAGYQVDICERVALDLKRRLGLTQLEVRHQLVTASNRIPMVQTGAVDMECGSTTNNQARQRDVAFSLTTLVEEVRIAVRANSGIASFADLSGKNVATTLGTTSVQVLRHLQRQKGLRFNELQCQDHGECFSMLEAGRADAFIMDSAILAGNIARSSQPDAFRIVGDPLSVEPIAIMLPRGDVAFKQAVDDSLRDLMRTGDIQQIWSRWFEQPIPPLNHRVGMPANASTRSVWADPNDRPKEAYVLR